MRWHVVYSHDEIADALEIGAGLAAGYSNKGSLRWVWNRARGQVTPWSAENSKESR
jgi:hypothetical protein